MSEYSPYNKIQPEKAANGQYFRKVQNCNENQNHYCKVCQDQDSDHFSSNCPSRLFPQQNPKDFKCRVVGCQENHAAHYCKVCQNHDSNHFSSSCSSKIEIRSPIYSDPPNDYQVQKNRIHCKIPNCLENHAAHYCKVCRDQNSNHYSPNCPSNLSNIKNSQMDMKLTNKLEHSNDLSSNNFQLRAININNKDASDYLNNSFDKCKIKNDTNKNYQNKQLKCKIDYCSENHSYHYCKLCQNQDADHFISNCPVQVQVKKNDINVNREEREEEKEVLPYQNNRFGKKFKNESRCKVEGCNEYHFNHFCKVCQNPDSSHFSKECPQLHVLEKPNNGNSQNFLSKIKNKLFPSNSTISLPHKKSKNWDKISVILKELEKKKIMSYLKLEELLVDLYEINSENSFKIVGFPNLKTFFQEFGEKFDFFYSLLPFMASLALELPKLFPDSKLKLLAKNNQEMLELSKKQVACLFAHLFFGTIPNRPTSDTYQKIINLEFLLLNPNNVNLQKLLCIFNYFNRVQKWKNNNSQKLSEKLIYQRVVGPLKSVDWLKSTKPLKEFHISYNDFGMENQKLEGVMEVDFANKLIGGGTLKNGSVQEEIRFMISPECIVSMLFFESFEDNELAFLHGTDKINLYKGYKQTFEITGTYEEMGDRVEARDKDVILVMDALAFKNRNEQYFPENMYRELNKAYIGFSFYNKMDILTGKWGCGVFKGDPQLKFILQWIAASECDKTMNFCSFGDFSLNTDILTSFVGMKVQKMMQLLLGYSPKYGKLFDFLCEPNIFD